MFMQRAVATSRAFRSNGFTLLETVMVLAVVATITMVGLPSMRTFLLDSRRVTAGNDLVATLNHARGEAVLNRTAVTVCRSENPTAENPVCAKGGGWESGWIAFVDDDADGERDAGEAILRQHESLPSGTTLNGNSKVVARVTFKPSGITSNNGSFALCDSRGWGAAARVVIIATSGCVRTADSVLASDNPLSNCTPNA